LLEMVNFYPDKTEVDISNPSVVTTNVAVNLVGFVKESAHFHRLLFDMPLIITSMRDGTHVEGSAHPKGEAVDLRSHDLESGDQIVFFLIMARLQRKWAVVILDERYTISPHWHVQTEYSIGG
jgi:hypothetical protein